MSQTITATPQYKAASASRRVRVSLDGVLDSTAYGDLQSDIVSGTPTVNASSDLTISSVQATTAAMTIDGTTVSAGRGITFRVSGGVAGQTYRMQVVANTTLQDTLYVICPLKILAST